MTLVRRCFGSILLVSAVLALFACSPEVGSEAWCEDMREKPKKEWTATEAADYTKYCVFKMEKK